MGVNGLYGLSGSGLDIESMVKAGMLSKQNQYDKMYKKEVKNEWLKQGFNEIYTSLNTFKYSTLSDYKMQSNMSAMEAESSNTSTVKVTANGAAVAMTHNVEVKKLSSNAYLTTSQAGIQREGSVTSYSYKGVNYSSDSDVKIEDGVVKSATLWKSSDPSTTIVVTGDDLAKVKPNYGITLDKVVFKSIKEAGADTDGVMRYAVTTSDGTYTFRADETAISFTVQDDGDTLTTEEKNKQTIKYTYGDLFNGKTLNDLAADIKNLNTNITASYDSTNDVFSIYNSVSGEEAQVGLTMNTEAAAKLFTNLHLAQSEPGKDLTKDSIDFSATKTALVSTEARAANVNTDKPNSNALRDVLLQSLEARNVDEESGKPVPDANGDVWYNVVKEDEEEPVAVKGTDVALSFTIQRDANDATTKQTIKITYADLAGDSMGLNNLASMISGGAGSGIAASYGGDGKFSISSTSQSFALTANDEMAKSLFTKLKLGKSEDGAAPEAVSSFDVGTAVKAEIDLNKAMKSVTGSEGEVKIDGRTYTDVKDNRITVSGVTYNLLNKTEEGKPVTVSVTQDTDKIIENVKKFVEDYNKILDDLTKKYNTKPSGDYEPLSKTQEASMTQEQIDKWTEKAKEGLFYHNDILRQLISDMRDAIMTPVQSVHSEYNSASAIGITSTNNQGHLTLDEDKLKKALAADPDCVYELFASDQDTYTEAKKKDRYDYMAKDDYKNRGIANRLYFNAITDGIKKVEDFAGVLPDSNDQSSLGLLITQLKDRMTDFKKMMDDYQTQLYKRYDALETMIASLNSQYNTLFGGQQ